MKKICQLANQTPVKMHQQPPQLCPKIAKNFKYLSFTSVRHKKLDQNSLYEFIENL